MANCNIGVITSVSKSENEHMSPSDIDRHLLAICGELVKKNKQIKLDKLYNIARREVPAQAADIIQGIKRLEDNMVIKAGSRLLKQDLLKNETRRELFHLVFRNPGISFNQIRKQMGRGTKILLWHLQLLLEFRCFLERLFENAKAFFTHHFEREPWTEDDMIMFILFQNPSIKRILDVLSGDASYSIKDIEQRLEMSRQLVDYHLKKLQQAKIIDLIMSVDAKRFFLTSTNKRMVEKCKEYYSNLGKVAMYPVR